MEWPFNQIQHIICNIHSVQIENVIFTCHSKYKDPTKRPIKNLKWSYDFSETGSYTASWVKSNTFELEQTLLHNYLCKVSRIQHIFLFCFTAVSIFSLFFFHTLSASGSNKQETQKTHYSNGDKNSQYGRHHTAVAQQWFSGTWQDKLLNC